MVNAPGDADVDIVKAAVDVSLLHTTTLIGEDTDLLVLLLYYVQGDRAFISNQTKSKADGSFKVYDINNLTEVLEHDMCSQLMFIHAVTGCDTTSQIFGVGRKTTFQKLAKGLVPMHSLSQTRPQKLQMILIGK